MKRISLFFSIGLFLMAIVSSCSSRKDSSYQERVIDAKWEFSEANKNEWLPATVPGTVHADLLANGIIEDPHYRMNEDELQWIEDKDWEYRTSFKVSASTLDKGLLELGFEGLDTYADVYLNEKLILSSDNMFVGHWIDVKNVLLAGENLLRVYFHSPVRKGMEKLNRLDYIIPAVNEQAPENERTNVFTRKAPFHYGWDWGPRLVTSGIWRPVVLRSAEFGLIEDVFVETVSANNEEARLKGFVELEVLEDGLYSLNLRSEGLTDLFATVVELKAGSHKIPFELVMDSPKLWWSNGLGEPYLYDFKFTLKNAANQELSHSINYGVRTLKLVQNPDEQGHTFYFELNGVPVFMKGANYIPSNTLTPSVDKASYNELIKSAVDANMNMLRVWGGAIYEEDYFYELCDSLGILIWQDFMFACALQPGDKEHLENIRKEAEYNVKRLRNHACMAMWCGNNENLHGLDQWWNDIFDDEVDAFMKETYNRIFLEILPAAVEKHHPGMQYWSSSPSSFKDQLADRKSGDEHDWTVWFGQAPFSAYGENVPRFVSEYGLQSFPDMHTIKSFTEEGDREWDSEVMRHRQRGKMEYMGPGFDGNDMIRRYMERYYQVPEKFEDFVYVSQLLQAKAYKTAIEAHRRNMPHCMGSLYWQLNDSWPTVSWSSVDHEGRWKAAHYAVKKAYKEVIIAPLISGNMAKLYAVSDRQEPFTATLKGRLMGLNGTELFSDTVEVNIAANTSSLIFDDTFAEFITPEMDISDLVVVFELLENGRVIADNICYMVEPKDLFLHKANIRKSVLETEDAYQITLSSGVFVKDVFIDTPRGEAFVSDNYFDLIPGRPKTIELITDEKLDVDADIIIRSLNDLQQ